MKTVSSWDHLRPFGIDALTGEACSLMYRILCDLTAKGKQVVERCLSIQLQSENWNCGSQDDPHVASYVVIFVMWRRPGSPRRFADGVLAERHIMDCESVGER